MPVTAELTPEQRSPMRRLVEEHLASAVVIVWLQPGHPPGTPNRTGRLKLSNDTSEWGALVNFGSTQSKPLPALDLPELSRVLDALDRAGFFSASDHSEYLNESGQVQIKCRDAPFVEVRVWVSDPRWVHAFVIALPWKADDAAPWFDALRPVLDGDAAAWIDWAQLEVARTHPEPLPCPNP